MLVKSLAPTKSLAVCPIPCSKLQHPSAHSTSLYTQIGRVTVNESIAEYSRPDNAEYSSYQAAKLARRHVKHAIKPKNHPITQRGRAGFRGGGKSRLNHKICNKSHDRRIICGKHSGDVGAENRQISDYPRDVQQNSRPTNHTEEDSGDIGAENRQISVSPRDVQQNLTPANHTEEDSGDVRAENRQISVYPRDVQQTHGTGKSRGGIERGWSGDAEIWRCSKWDNGLEKIPLMHKLCNKDSIGG